MFLFWLFFLFFFLYCSSIHRCLLVGSLKTTKKRCAPCSFSTLFFKNNQLAAAFIPTTPAAANEWYYPPPLPISFCRFLPFFALLEQKVGRGRKGGGESIALRTTVAPISTKASQPCIYGFIVLSSLHCRCLSVEVAKTPDLDGTRSAMRKWRREREMVRIKARARWGKAKHILWSRDERFPTSVYLQRVNQGERGEWGMEERRPNHFKRNRHTYIFLFYYNIYIYIYLLVIVIIVIYM